MTERIKADFDRIAHLSASQPEHPDFYDDFVLSQIPKDAKSVLEIGCGIGRLARALARRGAKVTAVDLSPEMIRVASERAGAAPYLRFLCADFMTEAITGETFDAVLAVATLHHLPVAPAVVRMKSCVAPGGVLVIHDVRAASSRIDFLLSGLAAVPSGNAFRWIYRRLTADPPLKKAWADHGAGETYLDIDGVRAVRDEHLPGASIHRHSLWRYTIVWKRSALSE